MIRTILVDDHSLFSEGLEKLLIETQKFEVVQKFNSGTTFLNATIDPQTHLVLIDIEMPGLNGFDVIKRLRLKNALFKIVILSMHEETVYSNEALALGADAYLVKTLGSAALVELLLKVIQGEKIFIKTNHPIENDSLLSDREIEVLRLIAKGKTNTQIGFELSISALTVKTHRRNMIRKLSTSNTAQLISKALERGII